MKNLKSLEKDLKEYLREKTMKGKVLQSTTTIVTEILNAVPDSRDDDDILYVLTCQRLDNVFTRDMSFKDFFLHRKSKMLPSYETVSRIRRKLQGQYPLLKPSAKAEQERKEEEKFFKEWSSHEV